METGKMSNENQIHGPFHGPDGNNVSRNIFTFATKVKKINKNDLHLS